MRLPRLTWALALCAGVTAGAADAETRLSPEEMRVAAQILLDTGEPGRTLELVDALLSRDPGDVQALILKSQALRDLERTDEAQAAARSAWRLAGEDRLRFGSAMVMAQALASDERRTAAQLWLRRAAEVAPDPGARAEAEEAFTYVRSRNPWVFDFHFSASPSSNVNNGSRRNSFWFYGFPVDLSGAARALSGYEATAGVTATYRLLPGEYSTTELRFSAMQKSVWLSSEAKRIAPGATGSDFAYSAIEAGIRHQIDPVQSPFGIGLGATFGHNWYGGEDLSDYLQLQAEFDRSIGRRDAVQLAFAAERNWRRDSTLQSSDEAKADFGWVRQLANRDRLQAEIGLARTWSRSVEMAHDAQSLRLGWTKAEPVQGIRLSAGVEFERRDYDRSRYAPGGRQDDRLSANLSMTFEQVDYMGFVPTLQVTAGETRSNVGLFDARDFGLSLGFESAF
ncbi:DUF560 domain-containing protein [Aliigemmobacter aestuarii]|uniref:DUF560 domain-containing protein n=1 Tax=Aliigemmobacter aestuarii TaxID=1445661 RepID=A0A4S3MRE7_9RHOB|nr:surface lipoprotein assembly modifier [Gemmobacter aestuarii]THD84633.1 DUF560 domain-containing protein [Gemmobacter aestuarii]